MVLPVRKGQIDSRRTFAIAKLNFRMIFSFHAKDFKWKIRKNFFYIFILFGSFYIAMNLGLIINITPSMKPGLYIRARGPIGRGDIVAACLSDPFKSYGLEKHYIQKGTRCDGTDPIIKKIIAMPGDEVRLDDKNIIVNGIKLNYETIYKDSKGRALAAFPRGDYSNNSGYWLIGANDQRSWDSRYWGPIKQRNILYKLKPLLVW